MGASIRVRLPRVAFLSLVAAVLVVTIMSSPARAAGEPHDVLASQPPKESAAPNPSPPLSTPLLLAFVAILGLCLAALAFLRFRALLEAEAAGVGQLRRLPTTIEAGSSYLVAGPDPARAYGTLSAYVRAGAKGLVLSRRYPDDVRARHPVGSSDVLWLSRGYSRTAVSPTNLGHLVNAIEKHVAGREASVVLLDNLDYLVMQNGAAAVAKFIEGLTGAVATHHSRLLVPLDPASMPPGDFALLTRDLRRL